MLLYSHYKVVGGCQGVAMQSLECCGWLLGCCYAAIRMLWVVDRELLCSD